MNIAEAFAAHAKSRPGQTAVEDGERIVSWAELETLANRGAACLTAEGIAQGDIVGLALPDSVEHVALLWSLAWIGAVIFPINAPLLQSENEVGLGAHQLKAVIVEKAALAQVSGITAISLEQVFAGAPQAQLPAAAGGGREPLYCLQSSGTTGKPKNFMMTHNKVIASFRSDQESLRWTVQDRYVALIPPGFSTGCRLCFAALYSGAAVIISRAKLVEELVQLVREKRVTVTSMTPLHIRSLLEYGAGKEPIFPSLRSLRVSTGAITARERDLARRHVTPNIIIVYGCNEQSWISFAPPADQDAEPDSAGRLVAGLEAEIVDEDHQPLPFGAVGLLRVRSDHTAAGYLNDPEADARAFRDGWFYPMDLAAINEAGYIFLKGRADDLISCDGIKFYPIEVENVLLTHPDVKEAAVFGWPHPLHGEVAMAAVTAGAPETSKTLKVFCRRRLAAYKVPLLVMRVAEMPRNPNGKILKRDLKERLRRHIAARGGDS
ncbi:MAG: class I adenylate-forming enzyme family protein [Alphaproteobacteria bacterium]|nr:class I adenylate-forming enzyme family protein [Alphaproteobacteria bacterium]